MFFPLRDAPGDIPRLLPVLQAGDDFFLQLRMLYDLLPLVFRFLSSDIGLVLCFLCDVPPRDPVALPFIPDRRLCAIHRQADLGEGIPFPLQYRNLITIALRKMRELFVSWFFPSFSRVAVLIQKRKRGEGVLAKSP